MNSRPEPMRTRVDCCGLALFSLAHRLARHRWRALLVIHSLYPSKSFEINTCKSLSKQKALTIFRINTYEKHEDGGLLLLTRSPKVLTGLPRACRSHGTSITGHFSSRLVAALLPECYDLVFH